MKRLRVLVLVHEDLVPPDSLEGTTAKERMAWQTEYDVVIALREMGHNVKVLGLLNDLSILRTAIEEFKPHICFNLLEEFHGVAVYDQHVVSYLELMKTPYTGCNPRGLTIAHDKALCRKILSFHRVPGPRFAVFPMDRKSKRPARLEFPLFVKSAVEDASLGISQASVVYDDEKLMERVGFVHEKIGTDALVEEYIDGRELYVSVMGNLRLQSFPVLEMVFEKLPEVAHRIATAKVKWDEAYQEKIGLDVDVAEDLSEALQRRISRLAKRVYRILGLTGYARLDMRLTESGEIYLIEANPNPDLADGDLFAESAYQAGTSYPTLLRRILNLGLSHRAQWRSDLA
jgi:D-alanine-D-alanine ligase